MGADSKNLPAPSNRFSSSDGSPSQSRLIRLLGNLLQTGWIERSPDGKPGDLYRITEAGRTAFRHLCR